LRYKELLIDAVFGFLLPILVGYVALIQVFKTPGFILYWDNAFPYDPKKAFTQILYPWHWYSSAPYDPVTGVIFNLLFMPYVWLGVAPELANKIWFLQNFALAGISMNIASRILLPKVESKLAYYGGCVTASLSYMITVPAITSIISPPRMISYSALPLAIAIYIKMLETKRNILLRSLALVFAMVLVQVWSPLLPIMIGVMAMYQLWRVVISGGQRYKVLVADLKVDIFAIALFILLNSYWFLDPFAIRLFTGRFLNLENVFGSSAPPPAGLDINTLMGLGGFFSLQNVLTLDTRWITLPSSILSNFLMVLIPVIAFIPAFLFVKERTDFKNLIMFHLVLALFCITFGAKSPPFDYLTILIASATNATGDFARFLNEPAGLIFTLAYSYALLSAVVATMILTHINKAFLNLKNLVVSRTSNIRFRRSASSLFKIATVFVLILIVAGFLVPRILYTSYPGSGNLSGNMIPVQVPQEYIDVNNWLAGRGGIDRVCWLPMPNEVLFSFNWAQYPITADWIRLISSKPLLWKGSFSSYVYSEEILEGKTQHLGSILSIAGVKYIGVHYDLSRSQPTLFPLQGQENEEMERLAAAMKKQKDLTLVYSNGFIQVFENKMYESPIIATQSIMIIVGGFDTLTTLAEQGFDLRNSTIIFADQLNNSYVKRLIPLSNLIVLGSGQGIEDLYLRFAQIRFLYPYQYLVEANSSSTSGDATADTHFDQEGDFMYSPPGATLPNGSTLNMPLNVEEQGPHEVWMRVSMHPLGGDISAYINGSYVGSVNTNSSRVYFKWERVAETSLNKGEYMLSIKNVNETNTIDVALVAPTSELNAIRSTILDMLQGKRVVTVKRDFIGIFKIIDCQGTSGNVSRYAVYSNNYIAQSFTAKNPGIFGVRLLVDREGKPGNLIVELHAANDTGGISPMVLVNSTVLPGKVSGGKPTMHDFDFSSESKELIPGRKYWLLIKQEKDAGTPSNSYGVWANNNDTYTDGFMMRSEGGVWIRMPSQDLFFLTYHTEEEITYNLDEASYSIVHLYLQNVYNNTIREVEQIPVANAIKVLDYSMPFPGKYVITVNASSPFALSIPEDYTPLWRVTNIDNTIHVPSYSTLNGYIINKTGKFDVIIEYALNEPFEISIGVSIFSLIGVTLVVIAKLNTFARLKKRLIKR